MASSARVKAPARDHEIGFGIGSRHVLDEGLHDYPLCQAEPAMACLYAIVIFGAGVGP